MRRYLVVADDGVESRELMDFVGSRAGVEPSVFHLVVPTVPDPRHLTWEEGEAHAGACRRLIRGLRRLRAFDPGAGGGVGDADPILAIEDALRAAPYDEIVLAIATRAHRLRPAVVAQRAGVFGLPVVDIFGSTTVVPFTREPAPTLPQTA